MVPCPVCGVLGRLDEAMLSTDGPVCGECFDKKGGSMGKKGIIKKIGTVRDDGTVTGWEFSECDIPAIELIEHNFYLVAGYTVDELREISRLNPKVGRDED